MPDTLHVMVQLRSTPALAATSFGPLDTSPELGMPRFAGVQFDAAFSPVPIPPRPARAMGDGFSAMMSQESGAPTYIVRASVVADQLDRFIDDARNHTNIVGVFADPRIEPISKICPIGPVGTDLDIEHCLKIDALHALGMNGAGVKVVIVDTGINRLYLKNHGKRPHFDAKLSWGPIPNSPLGDMEVDHGTMCAFDVCIAAPGCTLVDHAVLTSRRPGGSVMDGLLSDAVHSYAILLSHMTQATMPYAGAQGPRTLVINNSWGMFHPSWDFPVKHPSNYSDNPEHPFNIIVGDLEAAGADILFAAGNCGPECPDGRCQGVTNAGIYGANSHPAVTCVAGVMIDNQRIGYSTMGPGRLQREKPDIACYTHFAGSGVYPADGGTSAATPVAAGVVAAIRRVYPSSILAPAELRRLLCETAKKQGGKQFDYGYGHGVIDVEPLLAKLEQLGGLPKPVKKKAARH